MSDNPPAKTPEKPVPAPPLIPETVLDAASQRVFMVSLFVLVQAWKVYDLYVLRNTELRKIIYSGSGFSLFPPEWVFVAKYLFLDGAIVWLNAVLRIPRLYVRPILSIGAVCALYLIDISLTLQIGAQTVGLAFPAFVKRLFTSRELVITEKYIDSHKLEDQSSHFKGRKVIRYAPDSFIALNPHEDTFCLPPEYGKSIQIPVSYESVNGLEELQLRFKDLNNEVSLLNFTKKEIRKYTVKQHDAHAEYDPAVSDLHTLLLPVWQSGVYTIHSASDFKDKTIRPQRSVVVVPVCPEASFSVANAADLADKCVEDEMSGLSISVLGVPPFTLYYEEEINGVLSHLPRSVLVPDTDASENTFQSPLLAKELYMGKSKEGAPKYTGADLRDVSWARTRSISVPVGSKGSINRHGEYIYTINKIIDGFGNKVEYVPDPANKDTFASFKVHPMPTLNFVDTQPHTPILLGQKKNLEVRLSQSQYSSEAPYTVLFKYTPEDTEFQEQVFSKTFDLRSPARIVADKPGTYSIESASSKYCSCKLGTTAINVRQAKLPQLKVAMDPIVDQCVGTTGFKFSFEFVGSAPFEIGYQISKLDPHDSNKVLSIERVSSVRSESTVLEYAFNPPSEGSYAIEFVSLSDKYYKNKVRFSNGEHRYITYFKQRPRAYFGKRSKVQRLAVCNGGAADVSLALEGKAPFKVEYNIVSPDYEVNTYTLEDVKDSVLLIKTPPLSKGGEYVLSLKNVSDSSSCVVDFKGQEVHVNVKNEIPKLSFAAGKNNYTLVQGKELAIPLKTESNQQIDLVYKYKPFNGAERKEKARFDPTVGLKVSREGEYSLVSFTQGGCPGAISKDITVTVTFLKKPILELLGDRDTKSLCQNTGGSINFRATGASPFVVRYSVKYPDGSAEDKVQQLPNRNFAIQLKTAQSGDYEYAVKNVYDSVYPASVLDRLQRNGGYHFEPITVKNTVNALPSAHIVNSGEDFQTCVTSLKNRDQLNPLTLSLTGKLPIDLKLVVTKEQGGTSKAFRFNKLQSRVVNIYSIYEQMGLGTYTVSVAEVKDSNGCVSRDFDNEHVTIQVNDVPKIRNLVEESSVISDIGKKKIDKVEIDDLPQYNYYCVGDYITYLLSGVPPFTVYYEFNGKKQVVKVDSNYFKRRAPEDGEMNILAIADSSSKSCMVNFTNAKGNTRPDLKAKIFDLPSVEIVKGNSWEEDIYEGEQADISFRFSGQPPFKLTYVRSELSGQGKIVETEVVENIHDYEYKISANLEGTYEAIEIQDAVCIARNRKI